MDYFYLAYLLVFLVTLPLLSTNRYINPFIFYVWLSAVLTAFWPFTRDLKLAVMVGLQSNAVSVMALTLVLVLLLKSKINDWKVVRTLGVIGVANIVFTLILRMYPDTWGGMISNPGINQIFTVALLPYVMALSPSISIVSFIAVTLLTITSGSSCAMAALASVIFFGIIRDESFSNKTKYILLSVLGAIGAVSLLLFNDTLLNGYSRFFAYHVFFREFNFYDYVFGKGAGSFYTLSIVLQVANNFIADGFYIFMHSDLLQSVFEYGLLGTLLLIPLLFWFARCASLGVFLSTVAVLAGGSFYYPLHSPLIIALVFINIKLAYDTRPHIQECKGL